MGCDINHRRAGVTQLVPRQHEHAGDDEPGCEGDRGSDDEDEQ